MWRRRLVLTLLSLGAACDRPGASRDTSGVRPAGAPDSPTGVAITGDWPTELGSALIVPADTENVAMVLYPTSATPVTPQTRFSLWSPGGDTVRTRVGAIGPDSAHCGNAPMVQLAQPTARPWSLGISGAAARVLRTDSLEDLTESDSVRYLTTMSRLASVVVASESSRLAGLPFTLTSLRRVRFGDTTIVVAELIRKLNQEANPVEERTLVVAEQRGVGEFTTVHSNRSEGIDETTAHHELAGAFRAKEAIYLLLTTDTPAGSMIEVLERSAGAWRTRWSRTVAC